jgi:hypothetical protein
VAFEAVRRRDVVPILAIGTLDVIADDGQRRTIGVGADAIGHCGVLRT